MEQKNPEPRPEETKDSIKTTGVDQMVVTESLKNVPGAGVREFDKTIST